MDLFPTWAQASRVLIPVRVKVRVRVKVKAFLHERLAHDGFVGRAQVHMHLQVDTVTPPWLIIGRMQAQAQAQVKSRTSSGLEHQGARAMGSEGA